MADQVADQAADQVADQAADQAAKPLPPAAGRAWPPSSARWPVVRGPGIAPPGACLVAGYLVHLVPGSWPAGLVAAQLVHLVAGYVMSWCRGYVMSWCRGYVMSWCQVIPDLVLVADYLVHLVRGPRYLVRGLQLVAVARRPGGRAGQARRARTWWPCLHPRPGGRLVFACRMQTGPQLVAVAADQVTAHLVRWPAGRRPGAPGGRPPAWCGGRPPGSPVPGPWPADQVPRPADQVARTTARAAWRASEDPLPGVQKTGRVAGCAGFSPISHGMCCTKQFSTPLEKGPLFP